MREERKAILALIALGRLTPADAERLLAASDRSRDDVWIVIACAVAVATQAPVRGFVSALSHLAILRNPETLAIVTHAATGVFQSIRGML